ncbi:MAG: hypothetical protein ACI9H6_000442 [Patiriisocius sp.]|jgi:hypothetical protein
MAEVFFVAEGYLLVNEDCRELTRSILVRVRLCECGEATQCSSLCYKFLGSYAQCRIA